MNNTTIVTVGAGSAFIALLAGCGMASKTSPVDYGAIDFQHLEVSRDAAWKPEMGLATDNDTVAFAWQGVITNLLAHEQALVQAQQALADADVLNLKTVVNNRPLGNSQAFMDRRKLANKYGDTVSDYDLVLANLPGLYLQDPV